MAKRQNKGTVVYEYLEVFAVELHQRFGGEQTTKDILRHLVERGIVDPKRLRNYMIIYDFDEFLKFNEGNRTHTFMDLSIKYDITERQAQSVVYKERRKSVTLENVSW